MPGAAGRPGVEAVSSLRIVEDAANAVTLDASLTRPSVVVLRDSYDSSWTVTVDGEAATIARANGIYRGVPVPAGRHTVRFRYRPVDFEIGLTISVAATAALWFGRFRRRLFGSPGSDRGFTLLELMIVLAIVAVLLSVAFAEYRGLQAKGNEASALASMRSISVAQWQFALTCGGTKYASTLGALADPVPQTGHAFISPDLAQPNGFEKSGYTFQMAAKPIDNARPACNGAAVAEGYAATADPVKPGVSGRFYYGVNADRVVFTDVDKTFTGNLPETGPPQHGVELKEDVK